MSDATAYKITVSGEDEDAFWDLFVAGAQRDGGRGEADEHPLYIFESKTKILDKERYANITFFHVEPKLERGKPIVALVNGIPDSLFYRDMAWHGGIPCAGFEKLRIRVEIVGGSRSGVDGEPWNYRAVVENGHLIHRTTKDDLSILERKAPEAVKLLPPPYVPTAEDLAMDREEEEQEERDLAEVNRLWPLMGPGDVFEIHTEEEMPHYLAIVEKANDEWVTVREHADVIDGAFAFSGWKHKLWKKNTMLLRRRETTCGHGHDVRSSTPCGECRFATMAMIGGLHKRPVL